LRIIKDGFSHEWLIVNRMPQPAAGQFSLGPAFCLSSRASAFCAARDLGEPRDVSRFLRHNNRAFGSHPYQADRYLRPQGTG
jgi:hypothetical protein